MMDNLERARAIAEDTLRRFLGWKDCPGKTLEQSPRYSAGVGRQVRYIAAALYAVMVENAKAEDELRLQLHDSEIGLKECRVWRNVYARKMGEAEVERDELRAELAALRGEEVE